MRILKRNNEATKFEESKIENAILKAMKYGSGIYNEELAKKIATEIKEATKQSLDNVKAILEAGGTSMDNVIKTVVFVKNMDDFAAVNEVYATYFNENPPARSCVAVAKLPMDAVIEIEAIATL